MTADAENVALAGTRTQGAHASECYIIRLTEIMTCSLNPIIAIQYQLLHPSGMKSERL
jgi:hypothetical protein